MRQLTVTLFILVGSSAAFAGQDLACLAGPAAQQLECVQTEFENSEFALNKTYEAITAELQQRQEFGNERNFVLENMSSRLRISQRAWLYFRSGQCELESFSKINQQHVISAQILCNTKMNLERTAELKEFFGAYLKKEF